VHANIAHGKIGDLRLVLQSPDSKSYLLKPYGSEPGGTLRTTYGVDATDAVANGTWTLKVTDSRPVPPVNSRAGPSGSRPTRTRP